MPPRGRSCLLRNVPPFDWRGLSGFAAARAIPCVEMVAGGACRRTPWMRAARTVVPCWLRPSAVPHRDALRLEVSATSLDRNAMRFRRQFDPCCDPVAVRSTLRDPAACAGRWRPYRACAAVCLRHRLGNAAP